jgi:hypothetical protein
MIRILLTQFNAKSAPSTTFIFADVHLNLPAILIHITLPNGRIYLFLPQVCGCTPCLK